MPTILWAKWAPGSTVHHHCIAYKVPLDARHPIITEHCITSTGSSSPIRFSAEEELGEFTLVENDVTFGLVVEAHGMEQSAGTVPRRLGTVARCGDGACGIFGMQDRGRFLGDGRVGALASLGNFIADAPGENTGVVAVAADERAFILFMTNVEEVVAGVVTGALCANHPEALLLHPYSRPDALGR